MKSIVALSGGMDSATVMARMLYEGDEVTAVSFLYGSKHGRHEKEQADEFVAYYRRAFGNRRVRRLEIDLSLVFQNFRSNLLLHGGAIPEGHYADETMKLTVVPGRNLIFLSILAGLAESIGAERVGIGIHQGDHAIYPDCRPEFFDAADRTILASTDGKVGLYAPFLDTDKAGILRWGIANGVPYELTRTCYKDQKLSCGRCGSCVERLEAFALIGEKDPIEYEEVSRA